MFNPQRAQDQLETDTRNRLDWARTQGAVLRGELGEEAQGVAIAQLAAEYRAARAAGNLAEAMRIKALVFTLVPMTESQQ